jgi:RNA polymerase-binding protein DksA
MKKAEIKPYKEMLIAMRARLRGDVNALAEAALKKTRSEANGDLSSMPIHMADIRSDNYDQEFTLSMMETEETTLDAIESALQRIEDRSYGTCEDCNKSIRKTRLKAIPYTTLCINCASLREQR